MKKRIIIILIVALIITIPAAFLMDSIFSSMASVAAGTLGFTILAVGAGFFIVTHEKVKSKPLMSRALIFCLSMIAYIAVSWIIFIAFLAFILAIGASLG